MTKQEVDPDKIRRNKKYSNDFKVEVHFKDACLKCKSSRPPEELCINCINKMKDTDFLFWITIQKILGVSRNCSINDYYCYRLMTILTILGELLLILTVINLTTKEFYVSYIRFLNKYFFQKMQQSIMKNLKCLTRKLQQMPWEQWRQIRKVLMKKPI